MPDVQGPFKLRQRFAIIRACRQLKRSGVQLRGMDKEEAAGIIAAQMMDDDPAAFDDPSFDWAALIELILQMLPLILILFGL